MIARKTVEVGVQAEQPWPSLCDDAGLFLELTNDRALGRFSELDAATREMPARIVAMPHQENAAFGIADDRLRAHGQRARRAPVPLQQPLPDARHVAIYSRSDTRAQ